MKARTVAILTGLFLLVAAAASAQTRTSVGIGEAFSVAATASPTGTPATALRLYLDLKPVGPDVTLGVDPEAVFQVPGIATPGLHKLEASALNPFGEGPKSAALTFCVGPPSGCVPPAPGLPRIQVTGTQVFEQVPLEQGGIMLRLVSSVTAVAEVK